MMFKFLQLIFSSSGWIGRETWWWTQLISISLVLILISGLSDTSGRISQLSSIHGSAQDALLQSLSPPEKAEMLSEDWNIIYALVFALMLLFWAHFVIEIKRWHDLSLSGFCVWIRIVPALAHSYLGGKAGALTSIGVAMGSLYFLGFRPGLAAYSQGAPPPARSRFAILNDAAGPVGLMVLILALFKFGFISPPPDMTITFSNPFSIPWQSVFGGGGRHSP